MKTRPPANVRNTWTTWNARSSWGPLTNCGRSICTTLDSLREGVRLRAQGQKDPLVEYKSEAYDLFVTLMDSIKSEAIGNLFKSTTNLDAFEDFLASLPQFETFRRRAGRRSQPPGNRIRRHADGPALRPARTGIPGPRTAGGATAGTGILLHSGRHLRCHHHR